MVSIVNYFYRMSYYSDATYSAGLQIPTVDQIESELSKTKIGMYATEVDFSTIIQILEQKLQKLMDFTHPRAVWHILNLISSIKDYQLYCNSIQYRHLNIIDEGKEQYGLYDKKTFFLKPGNNVGEIKGSVFFNKNTIICQNMNCSIVLDKRWTVKDDANFKVQNIVLDNGTEQTAVVMKIATYAEAYRRYLATYIHAIYDWDNYSTYYHKDLLGANNNIIISSPVISGPKVYDLINLLKEKQMSGVQTTIVTWTPEFYRFGDAAYWMQLHEDMRQAGFYIKTVEESCERFAVIDQEVVWYGNINLLAKDKVDDGIMRVLSKEIASELMEITFGDNG